VGRRYHRTRFQQPSNEFKPFTRWWWFGTASREEIRREMEGMALAGFGGVEIQTIYSALPGHPSKVITT